MMSSSSKYIVIEGLEGAGKSSAIRTVCRVLQQHQLDYQTIREPGGTLIAESLRKIIKGQVDQENLSAEAELLLMYAARKQLLDTVIKPALASDTWIVSDRNEWSSIAYQGYGRGLDLQFIQNLSQFIVGDVKPSLILYLDIDPELGLKRAAQRSNYDRIEQESRVFFERVHEGYQRLAAGSNSVRVIAADMPFKKVQKAIVHHVNELIIQSDRDYG